MKHQCSFLFLLHLYKNDIAHKKIGKKNIKNSDIQNNWLPLTAKKMVDPMMASNITINRIAVICFIRFCIQNPFVNKLNI